MYHEGKKIVCCVCDGEKETGSAERKGGHYRSEGGKTGHNARGERILCVCCWANAHTSPRLLGSSFSTNRCEDGSSSSSDVYKKDREKCAQEGERKKVLPLSLSLAIHYLLDYISNKVDKLGWKDGE